MPEMRMAKFIIKRNELRVVEVAFLFDIWTKGKGGDPSTCSLV